MVYYRYDLRHLPSSVGGLAAHAHSGSTLGEDKVGRGNSGTRGNSGQFNFEPPDITNKELSSQV